VEAKCRKLTKEIGLKIHSLWGASICLLLVLLLDSLACLLVNSFLNNQHHAADTAAITQKHSAAKIQLCFFAQRAKATKSF